MKISTETRARETPSEAGETQPATRDPEPLSRRVRTPLRVVVRMMDLFLRTPGTEEQRKLAEEVRGSAGRLLESLGDRGDPMGAEARSAGNPTPRAGPELTTREFHLRPSMDRLSLMLSNTAHRFGIGYFCHIFPDVPDRLEGDWVRLSRVLTNLIGNAVEFTREGRVTVEVSVVERSGGEATLRFSVSDTGSGIPMDRLSALYEKLNQDEVSTEGGGEEAGRGMAMAARQARGMGGHIFVQSREGEGSAFHFTVVLGLPEGDGPDPELEWIPLEGR